MMVAGLAGHMLQSLPSFSFDKIAPDFSKVSPLAGFKRLFGAEGWMNLLKGLAKIAVVGVAIWTQLWPSGGSWKPCSTSRPSR
jgi:flagellar biosynthetic protein FlhB